MRYKLEKLSSVEFEVLAANYVNKFAPSYNWHLTKETVDFNRDFEAFDKGLDKWGEAKHTENYKKNISKSQWDPTIVSAVLKNSVNEIFLVTCGWIPLEYVDRVEHFRQNRQESIDNIYYINRSLLDKWLENANINELNNFNKDNIDIVNIMQNIKCENENAFFNDNRINISVYSISGDLLEQKKYLYSEIIYEVDIMAFTHKENILNVNIPKVLKVIECRLKALSSNGEKYTDVEFDNNGTNDYLYANLNTKSGYNRLSLIVAANSMCEEFTSSEYSLEAHFIDNSYKAKKILK